MAEVSSGVDLRPPPRVTASIVFLCWLAILSEGYDVGVMGAILPSLATDAQWHLTPIQLGALGSYGLVGMLFGGMGIGTLGDLYGRKRLFLVCLVLFSLAMGGAAWAPTPTVFAIFRLVGGLGLGGIIPIAASYTVEFSAPERRGLSYGLMYSGYSCGTLASALVALALLPSVGWRGVVGCGLLPLALVPLIAWRLPESVEHLLATGQAERAREVARQCRFDLPTTVGTRVRAPLRSMVGDLFEGSRAVATPLLWVAISAGLLLVYGLGTWLPQIMRRAGYDLGSSLTFLVVFSAAAGIGGAAAGLLADRRGMRLIVVACYVVGATGIACLSIKGPLVVNYLLVSLAGLGSISASLILTAFIAAYYPPHIRAAATGAALSVARFGAMGGPLLGGLVASSGWSTGWNFYAFAMVALIAGLATACVPPGMLPTSGEAVPL